MASLGSMAGHGLSGQLLSQSAILLVPGLAAGLAALTVGLLLARRLLHADVVESVGLVTGAIANTPAMEAGSAALDTDAPASTYALLYPMAIVAQVLAAQIVTALL